MTYGTGVPTHSYGFLISNCVPYRCGERVDVQRCVGAIGLDDLHSSPFGGFVPCRRQLRIPGVFLAAGSRRSFRGVRLSDQCLRRARSTPNPLEVIMMKKSKIVSLFAIALLFIPSVNIAFAVETLDVWTDQSSYELGDEVEISGSTDPFANVSLSIVFNDTMVVFLEADLTADENGTYGLEYSTSQQTVQLGFYNVTVSANGTEAETWFTVFAEPEDPDDEPLTVESAESIYYPGEIVEISGEASPLANVTVMVVFNSTSTLLDEDMTASEDGKFETSLLLSETAPEGLYDVSAVSGVEEASVWFSVVAAPVDDPDGVDGAPDDDDDGAPDGEGLENALERARLYLEKVRETLGRLAEEYENNTTVMDYIAKAEEALLAAEEHLDDAAAALEEGDMRTAARHLAAARNIMGRLKGFVNSVVKRHKVAKAEKFMEQAEARFQGLRKKIESLEGNLTLGGAQKVKNALTQAAGRMNGFKSRLSYEDVDDVLEDLQSLVDEVDDELDDIDGDEVSQALKGANALEARLRVLRQNHARLTRKYGNATEVDGDLEDVAGLIEEILEKVEAGRPQNAKEILKTAKELAKQAQKRYREAVKAHAMSVGRGNQNSERP